MSRQWKPIDSAPKDGRDVLVYCADTKEQMVAFLSRKNVWQFAFCRAYRIAIVCSPSHWMELPEPPKQ